MNAKNAETVTKRDKINEKGTIPEVVPNELESLQAEITEIKSMVQELHQLFFSANPKSKIKSKVDIDKEQRSAKRKAQWLKPKNKKNPAS